MQTPAALSAASRNLQLPAFSALQAGRRYHCSLPVSLRSRSRRVGVQAVLDPTDLLQHAETLRHLPLAYEPVALPCSLMKCGDVVYKSTLDPVLRREVAGPDWRSLLLLSGVALYFFVPPGVLPGFIDYYVIGPLQRALDNRVITKDDINLGKRLGTGAFGSVYKAEIRDEEGTVTPVVVKKAKEFGEAEVWMNERLQRQNPKASAEFITAFSDPASGPGSPETIWIVWKFEGGSTLWDMMQKRDFPYNLEPLLLGRDLRLPKGKRRRLVTLQVAMRQLLEAVASCHASGIVHRDVKPQNVIISETDKRLKLIDLGAAADLRVGINYIPNEYLLDPRYAPPQQYIMSVQTPRPPPKPVAALLSPILWRMEQPDKFDMYSVGISMLQLAFPSLRSDNNLIAFNRKLKDVYNFDLRRWRQEEVKKGISPLLQEGFEVLDLEGGAGWDLVCKLVRYERNERLSAADALAHPFLSGQSSTYNLGLSSLGRTMGTVTEKVGTVLSTDLIAGAFIHERDGGLTEAQLAEELGYGTQARKLSVPQRSMSQTIAWFQDRQSMIQKKLMEKRRASSSASSSSNGTSGRFLAAKSNLNGNGKVAAAAKPSGKVLAIRNNGNGVVVESPATASVDGNDGSKNKVRELLNVFKGRS